MANECIKLKAVSRLHTENLRNNQFTINIQVRKPPLDGELLYTIYKEPNGLIQIYRHGVLDDGILELLLEQQAERDHGDFHTRESVAGERGAPPFLGPRVSR